MKFRQWLESQNPKKLLILVHPDCISEVSTEDAKEYTQLLKQHLPKFDFVITHLFFHDDRAWSAFWDQERTTTHKTLYATIKQFSNLALHNPKDAYTCSYDQHLPDFLIEHPNTEIYMAGGYESNCLWISYLGLFRKLGWLLKEQNHKVHYYKPLLFHDQSGNGLKRTRQFKKEDDFPFDPRYASSFEPFHPDKVNYKDQ